MNTSTYALVIEKFKNPSFESYMDVIEICSANIRQDECDASSHYIKAMALFGLATLIKNKDEVYAASNNEEVTGSCLQNGSLIKKIESNLKLADTAVEEFNIAYKLDNDIIEKHKDLRVIVDYNLTGVKYSFSKPIPSKDIQELLFQDTKWSVVGILGILTIIAIIITAVLAGELLAVKVLLGCTIVIILTIFLYPNENMKILNKYKNFISKIK